MIDLGEDGLGFVPGATGRTLVLLEEEAPAERPFKDIAGLDVMAAAELPDEPVGIESLDAQGVTYGELGVAVVDAEPDQVDALGAAVAQDNPILVVEPERLVYALGATTAAPSAAAPMVSEANATWGLQATGVLTSAFTGRGIRVAVLDTGFDLQHPDFAGRNPVTQSFIPGESVQDGNGHGTHCIGTSCGPRVPQQLPRYGIASDARIHAGKVLSNRGSGTDQQILGGINWALANQCQVISMSLGADVPPGTPFSRIFEAVGFRALARGSLIVAAAGNASRRDLGRLAPVGHPANCPSFLAVAAIDASGRIANFSSTTDLRGGAVDIAGPGVAVHSSWPMPTRYRTISGTSMATPHVAGISALIAEGRNVAGLQLWGALMQSARRLPLSSNDVGSGLVQAP